MRDAVPSESAERCPTSRRLEHDFGSPEASSPRRSTCPPYLEHKRGGDARRTPARSASSRSSSRCPTRRSPYGFGTEWFIRDGQGPGITETDLFVVMATIRLVRHGQAAAGWDDHRRSGRSDVGRAQADAVADALAPLGPLPIVTSPLRRCQETAAPLATRWGVEPLVEPDVGEVASPVDDLGGRVGWLRTLLARGRWSTDATDRSGATRVVDCLLTVDADDASCSLTSSPSTSSIGAVTATTVVICRPRQLLGSRRSRNDGGALGAASSTRRSDHRGASDGGSGRTPGFAQQLVFGAGAVSRLARAC